MLIRFGVCGTATDSGGVGGGFPSDSAFCNCTPNTLTRVAMIFAVQRSSDVKSKFTRGVYVLSVA